MSALRTPEIFPVPVGMVNTVLTNVRMALQAGVQRDVAADGADEAGSRRELAHR